MCGRFTDTKVDPGLVAARFGVAESAVPGETLGRFNICPTEDVLAITDAREPKALRWGLIPPWARKLRAGPEPINARSEDAQGEAAVRAAGRRRRATAASSSPTGGTSGCGPSTPRATGSRSATRSTAASSSRSPGCGIRTASATSGSRR